MIVVIHLQEGFGINLGDAGDILRSGVSFFFVLSGFILTYVYSSRPKLDKGRFLLARFARLWPAHITALVLMWMLLPEEFKSQFTLPRLLANVFMVHSWIPLNEYCLSFVVPSWSISTEIGFYFCFLLLFHNWARTWHWKLALTFGMACGVLALTNSLDQWLPAQTASNMRFGLVYCHPLARLFEFTLGMSTALFWKRASPRIRLRPAAATVLEVATGVFACFWLLRIPVFAASTAQFGWIGWAGSTWVGVVGGCLAFAPLIFVMALHQGAISRLLTFRPLVILGEISFSIYLIHQPLIIYINKHPREFSMLPHNLTLALFFLLVIAVAYLIWALIEIPCRGFIVRLWPARTEEPAPKKRAFHQRPRERFFARAALVVATLTVTMLTAGGFYLVKVRSTLQTMSAAEASQFMRQAIPELRDVRFGRKFVLLGVQVKLLATELQIDLAWRSMGRQRLGYMMPVYLMNANSLPIAQADRNQDNRQSTVAADTVWREVIVFPRERLGEAQSVAIGLLNQRKDQWLRADRGLRGWENTRLFIPLQSVIDKPQG